MVNRSKTKIKIVPEQAEIVQIEPDPIEPDSNGLSQESNSSSTTASNAVDISAENTSIAQLTLIVSDLVRDRQSDRRQMSQLTRRVKRVEAIMKTLKAVLLLHPEDMDSESEPDYDETPPTEFDHILTEAEHMIVEADVPLHHDTRSNASTSESNVHFRCGVCGKGFRFQSMYEVHLRVHSNDRPFKCSMCPKRFKQSPHLLVHTQRMHKK